MTNYNPRPTKDETQNANNQDLKILIQELIEEIKKLKAVING